MNAMQEIESRQFFSPTLESFFARIRQGCELEH